jgi:hypothetical protein
LSYIHEILQETSRIVMTLIIVQKYDTQVLDYKFQSWKDLSESSKSCLINHTKHRKDGWYVDFTTTFRKNEWSKTIGSSWKTHET